MISRRFLVASLVATAVFAAAPAAQADDAAAMQVAQGFFAAWVSNYNAGKPEAMGDMFTKNPIWNTPSGVVLSERDAIVKALGTRMKDWPSQSVTVVEAHEAGSAVWASGNYTLNGTGANEGKKITGLFGAVFERDGGMWKYRMVTSNAAAPK